MSEPAIRIENVKKRYRLGTIGGATLSGELQSWFARVRGKEDPNTLVGTKGATGDEFWALKGIDLEIEKGDRIGIIGRNGAGKSTLLKILSRVTAPTEGRVYINGKITSMLEVGTGFHGELTGRENIYLNGAILGMNRKRINERIDRIIEFSECGEFIDTPVKRYSSGMYVKLAFSVAAHLDSEIMIMDEVLAVGDVNFQRKALDKMSEVAGKDGKTILYVSHNMGTVRRLCNRCVVLEEGKVKYQGNVEDAIQEYLKVPDTMQIYNTFENREITDEQFNKKIRLLSLELLDRDSNQIEFGERIRFNLKFHCLQSVSRAYIRCIVSKMDDSRVGTAFSGEITGCDEDTVKSIDCELDISTLVTGRYGLVIILYDGDGSGYQEKFDMVNNALVFEIVRTKDRPVYGDWDHTNWGSSEYPELIINDVTV